MTVSSVATVTPRSADEAAAILADANGSGRRVAIRGGGTKADWSPCDAADIVLSTLALDRIVAHRHGDLTATIEAGARLDAVNRELARQGQWVALDPFWSDRATIGGIVATNDAGPRRHRYGAPRDAIIGVEIARADGVRARAGGIVVKNVAGYDIARLMTGSFGSLALIVSATFKLYPLPVASRTVTIGLRSHRETAELVSNIVASPLTPTAVELQSPPARLLVRFESTEASVQAQSAAVTQAGERFGLAATVLQGDEESQLWAAHRERLWKGSGVVLKVTLLPADLGAVLNDIEARAGSASIEIVGRVGIGVLYVRLDGDVDRQRQTIDALKQRVPLSRGSVVVLRGPDALKQPVSSEGSRALMQSVKRAFDASSVLAYRGID